MTSTPDLTPYIDLRILDLDAQDVFDAALQTLQTRLPTWVPREDNTEVMLLEALALEVAESVFSINRLPNAIMVALMKLHGVERDEGAPPVTTITFTVIDSFGYTISAGTRVGLSVPGSTDPIVFVTTEDAVIPDGSYSVTVPAIATSFTTLANGIASGTAVDLLDVNTAVETVELASDVTGGRGPEEDSAWLTRGVQRFRRLTDTLAVPSHFTAAALENPAVTRATTIDLYDPSIGPDPGDNPGHVTVVVYGDGALLDSTAKDAIAEQMDGQTLANLTVHVVDPTLNDVDVTVDVVKFPEYSTADLQARVEAAIREYLSPETWAWQGTVRRNELITLISNVPGVDYVDDLVSPAADVTLTGVAPLAVADTVVVNVL